MTYNLIIGLNIDRLQHRYKKINYDIDIDMCLGRPTLEIRETQVHRRDALRLYIVQSYSKTYDNVNKLDMEWYATAKKRTT